MIVAGVMVAIIAELLVLQTATSSARQSVAASTTTASTARLWKVTFHVKGICSDDSANYSAWGVTLGNQTKLAPSNVTIDELQNNYSNYAVVTTATITFIVTDGQYHYVLYPTDNMHIASADWNPTGGPVGTITVSGLDEYVRVLWIPDSYICG
jgi:hypothetical protein